ncbi:hypothetical protein ABPG74_005666 [Tetrahymena malaccensis]
MNMNGNGVPISSFQMQNFNGMVQQGGMPNQGNNMMQSPMQNNMSGNYSNMMPPFGMQPNPNMNMPPNVMPPNMNMPPNVMPPNMNMNMPPNVMPPNMNMNMPPNVMPPNMNMNMPPNVMPPKPNMMPGFPNMPPNPNMQGFPNNNFQPGPTGFQNFAQPAFPGGNMQPPFMVAGNMPFQNPNQGPSKIQAFKQTYCNQKWIFTINPNMKNNYQQKRQEFKNIINSNQNNPNVCFQFKLSEERCLLIKKIDFSDFQILGNMSNQIDLSIIYKITNSYQAIEDALYFCFYPYIELEENLEATRFLLACILLNIEVPFLDLSNYIKNLQQGPLPQEAHKLKSGDDIIEIILFQDYCNQIQELNQYSDIWCENKTPKHPFKEYLDLLIMQNDTYFYDQKSSSFNQKITRVNQQTFLGNILQHFIYINADKGRNQNQLISIQQVELVYKFLEFYYFNQTQYGNPKELVEKQFSQFYDKYQQLLSEEDKIEALKYQKGNTESFIKQLKNQYNQIQEHKIREKALIKIIIAQKAQNMAIESFKDQFKSMGQLLGNQLQKDIETQIEEEIQKIKGQQYQNQY